MALSKVFPQRLEIAVGSSQKFFKNEFKLLKGLSSRVCPLNMCLSSGMELPLQEPQVLASSALAGIMLKTVFSSHLPVMSARRFPGEMAGTVFLRHESAV